IICNRLPGTHLAHMAQLRINQLPRTPEELRELRNPKPIPIRVNLVNPTAAAASSELDLHQAISAANACVQKLSLDPNNIEEREKLAHLLAEKIDQVQQGLEQLILLMNMTNVPDSKRAEWLFLAANWHIDHRQDGDAGRKFFQRVVNEFPQSPQAASARRKLQ